MLDPGKCSPPVDAYSPHEMACKAETIGVTKANLDGLSTLMLAVLAGAFIGLAACFYTTAVTDSTLGMGVTRVIGGACFCLGLVLVVVAGAELFTGNVLIIMAFMSGRVSFGKLLRNWVIVYTGNLLGSLGTVALVYFAMQWKMGGGDVGVTAVNTAGGKLSLEFGQALCSGILCNCLVCLAVWLCYSARSTTDKILSLFFPITAFVALGFEHSVANMFFIPYGIAVAKNSTFLAMANVSDLSYDPSIYTVPGFLINNLLPVTLGNIIGGALFVGAVYWLIYLRGVSGGSRSSEEAEEREPTGIRSR